MVHLGGYPLGYDDDTLEAIQASGGGSVAHLDDALTRIASGLVDQRSTVDIVDGYVWRVMATEEVDKMSAIVQADELAPFAARRLILSEMVRQRDQLDQVEALDQLHAIAVENSIVTPYSSMIVLVNDRQQRLLDNLEENADRFERELEPVDDTLGLPITGVPEPHEYLLMALAGLGLIWYWRRTSKLKTFAS
jgi:putative PEP-CTERM system integral membrane protein